MGLACRQPPGSRHRQRPRSLTTRDTETRDTVTSPPLPVPDRIARGQLSPKSLPQLFCTAQTLDLLEFSDFKMPLSRGTSREPRKSRRGKSVEFDRDLFRVGKAGARTRDLRRDRADFPQRCQWSVNPLPVLKGSLNPKIISPTQCAWLN